MIGSFIPFIILFLIIIVHELGHFLTAIILKVDVDKIYIYPFGGISKLNIKLNESIYKEFIILIMGPLFQIIFSCFLVNINFFSNYKELIYTYNYSILIFNLLPIYPLDGGKLLNLILSLNFPFKRSYELSIYISYLTVIILFIINIFTNININTIVIISFLIYKVSIELKKKNILFDKFLLERYLNNFYFKKRKNVDSVNEFMRGRSHIIKINDKYYTERDVLNNKFKNKY